MKSLRQARAPLPSSKPTKPGGPPKPGGESEKSEGGAKLDSPSGPGGPIPELEKIKVPKTWGKLPPKLAEDLSKGSYEATPAEYREAVDTYYRVVAEKSKKP